MSGRQKTYNFSIYTFSDREIEAIVSLLKGRWNGRASRNVDMRKLSAQVREWAVSWGLLQWQHQGRSSKSRLVYTATSYNVRATAIPLEAVWRLAAPLLHEFEGDIPRLWADPRWTNLCIPAQMEEEEKNQGCLDLMRDVLFALCRGGYLDFRCLGGIWEITKIKEAPELSGTDTPRSFE